MDLDNNKNKNNDRNMEVSGRTPPREAYGQNGYIPDSPIWKRGTQTQENLGTAHRGHKKLGTYHGVPTSDESQYQKVNSESTRCGFFCWQPEFLQGFANMKVFVVLMSLLYLCNSTLYVYRLGVVTTIEKRFKLTSSQSGLTMSSFEISHLSSVMLISFFCKSSHRPRLVAIGGVLTFVAGIVFSIPHFLYGSGISQDLKESVGAVVSNSLNSSSLSETGLASLCLAHNKTGQGACDIGGEDVGSESGAFALFMVSSLILGISLVPINTLGLAYIDDNVPKEQAPLYLGIVLSMNQGGSITGFLLAAVFTSIFIDLGDPGIGPGDSGWLGAWWLGALILGLFTLIPAMVVSCFPKEMPQKPIEANNCADDPREAKNDLNIFSGLKKLFTNPIFLLLTIAACMDMHVAAGFLTFLPKYLEVQFKLGAYMANILAALLSGVTGMLGSFLGGAISSRLKSMSNTCLFLIINSGISTGALIVLAILSCGEVQLLGPQSLGGGSLTCNDCTCGLESFEPVCGSDGSNYMSACFAGCKEMSFKDGLLNLTSCGCDGSGYVTPGLCPSDCSLLVPYAIILVLIMLIASLNPTPAIALTLRNVGDDLKSLSLGIFNSGISLLTYIPGPTVFGIIIDGACTVWQDICGSPGACLWYDVAKYRVIIHGLTAGLRAIGICVYVGLWFVIRRKEKAEASKKELEESLSMNNYTKPKA